MTHLMIRRYKAAKGSRITILPNRVLRPRYSGESRYVVSNIRLSRSSTQADQPGPTSVVVSYW